MIPGQQRFQKEKEKEIVISETVGARVISLLKNFIIENLIK
jgi:hypothetical protein